MFRSSSATPQQQKLREPSRNRKYKIQIQKKKQLETSEACSTANLDA